MKLLWTRLALNDRSAIFQQNEPHTAIEIDVVIEEKMEDLIFRPKHGNLYMQDAIYMADLCYGYVMAYDIAGKYVRILRLLHLF